jgi:hypothetical protein
VSLKEDAGKPLTESSLMRKIVEPGMGLEGRGWRLSRLPRPALERPEREALTIWSKGKPDPLEKIELGLLHLPGRFGVAALTSLFLQPSVGQPRF